MIDVTPEEDEAFNCLTSRCEFYSPQDADMVEKLMRLAGCVE